MENKEKSINLSRKKTKKIIIFILIGIILALALTMKIIDRNRANKLSDSFFSECATKNGYEVTDKTDYAYSIKDIDKVLLAMQYTKHNDKDIVINSIEYYKLKSPEKAKEFEKNNILNALDEAYKSDIPEKSKSSKIDKDGNKQYIYKLGDTTCKVYRKGNVIIFSNTDNVNGMKNYEKFEKQLIPTLKKQ